MDREKKLTLAFTYLSAFTAGSLATSIGLYVGYDQWHPMVWSAGGVAVLGIGKSLVMLMSAYP